MKEQTCFKKNVKVRKELEKGTNIQVSNGIKVKRLIKAKIKEKR